MFRERRDGRWDETETKKRRNKKSRAAVSCWKLCHAAEAKKSSARLVGVVEKLHVERWGDAAATADGGCRAGDAGELLRCCRSGDGSDQSDDAGILWRWIVWAVWM